MERFTETSWYRLMNQYHKTGYCILSACRDEYDAKENKKRTYALKHDLEKKGFWPIKVSGGWIENKGTYFEKSVGEASWFVPFFFGNKQFSASQDDFFSTKTFFKWCLDLGTEYEQEAILYCPPNGKPRYVQATEKDYGEGPVKIGTHTMRFNKTTIGDNSATYFTDMNDPSKEGGYNQVEKRFRRAPRRVTFESKGVNMNFRKIYESCFKDGPTIADCYDCGKETELGDFILTPHFDKTLGQKTVKISCPNYSDEEYVIVEEDIGFNAPALDVCVDYFPMR